MAGCRASTALVNFHAPLIQANAWSVSLPALRAVMTYCLESLLAVSSQRPDLVCAVCATVAACSEVLGVFAAKAVRLNDVWARCRAWV